MRADARRNYEHILATARQAFAELGPDVPIDVIARRADLGNATLYRHFPTRDVLVEAVYRSDVAELTASALDFAERYPPAEALERWVRAHFLPAVQQQGLAMALKTALANAPEVFAETKGQLNEATDALVHGARLAGSVRTDPEAVSTRDILRMAYGVVVAPEGAPAARERMLTIMFDGLRQG
jgi:AcrR family transcriptional regulator